MSAVFSVIVGCVILLWIFTHYKLFREVNVDRLIPDCFRGRCDYYKEFYDPSHHKTPVPFSTNLKANNAHRIYTIDRDDYNSTLWDVKWQGKTLKTKGKVYVDGSENSAFTKLPSSDSSRIAATISADLPPLSQKHDAKNTIQIEDTE
tara:strand:- start:1006 stop:1449 length:444 start_codon:yes stop_codon:yes gene_type:complete